MATDTIIVNASPLIVLFKGGLSDILPHLFAEVLVPEAVWDEILFGGPNDTAAQQLQRASWAQRRPTVVSNPIITSWDLGAGEAEVLSLAINSPGARAMIDDAVARDCARTLGIPVLGTGGALVLAKRRGIINSVSTALQSLRDVGLWISEDIINLLKQQAGE